tara:strand:+ start:879 stop:1286 length:408 start_codon:yes stop_codon:yes gene_type:complete
MEFETRRRVTPNINLSALIDVAFILVIFIVLIANFNEMAELDVVLPEANVEGEVDPKALMIVLPAQGDVEIQGQAIAFEDVRAELAKLQGRFDKVLLMADQEASVQRAVKILEDAQTLGFKSVGIATKRGGGAGS